MTEQTQALTLPERAAVALNSTEHERKLVELAQGSKSITEITNPAGREQCHSARMALKRVRVDVEKIGKAAREDATAFSKAVIAEERRLIGLIQPEETRLESIQNSWDEKVAAEKRAKIEAEQRRIAVIKDRIEIDIRGAVVAAADMPSTDIACVIEGIEAIAIDDTFAEFKQQAEGAKATTLVRLHGLHTAAVKREEEAARLARERAELERQRQAQEAQQAAQERR